MLNLETRLVIDTDKSDEPEMAVLQDLVSENYKQVKSGNSFAAQHYDLNVIKPLIFDVDQNGYIRGVGSSVESKAVWQAIADTRVSDPYRCAKLCLELAEMSLDFVPTHAVDDAFSYMLGYIEFEDGTNLYFREYSGEYNDDIYLGVDYCPPVVPTGGHKPIWSAIADSTTHNTIKF